MFSFYTLYLWPGTVFNEDGGCYLDCFTTTDISHFGPAKAKLQFPTQIVPRLNSPTRPAAPIPS